MINIVVVIQVLFLVAEGNIARITLENLHCLRVGLKVIFEGLTKVKTGGTYCTPIWNNFISNFFI
jgi:hypothetical protein